MFKNLNTHFRSLGRKISQKSFRMTAQKYGGWFVVLAMTLSLAGCGQKCDPATSPSSSEPASSEKDAESAEPTPTESPLNLESTETPEGVTQQFFKAFFSGNDEDAYALLSEKAKKATQNDFSAEASDTIKWNVTKTSLVDDVAYVFVDVEDLNEEGEYAKEELIFVLTHVEKTWGIAGFSAGGLAINFENRTTEPLANQAESEPVRVGQTPSENSVR